MRIVIIGNSLALPRPKRINQYDPKKKEELAVSFDDTYGFLVEKTIQAEYPDLHIRVINRAQRAYTIKHIAQTFADHLFYFEPNILILNVGLVDCWFRDENGTQMVNKVEFRQVLIRIMSMLSLRPEVKIIIVGITPTNTKMENRYKGMNDEIRKYNEILMDGVDYRQTFYVDVEKNIQLNEILLPDGQHYNKEGNRIVAEKISILIRAFIESDRGVGLYNRENAYNKAFECFKQSFNLYPNYIDNIYNLLKLRRLKLINKP
ncbi:GDSL-type esterase/lipase family protein [Alkalihalobacillus oceani]|uniref:SGNH/GDSL hydrolase family protein n=1 Tax=Halalkalibacter oceani TaxID=1653776 RepID=UPI00204177C8|nr:GDSL-type esterase/lipase family protein [Halalkalibacter oceani]MCM3760895.1 GDSL-type esterase/lipase family protein [Halalkalibacter oceani]